MSERILFKPKEVAEKLRISRATMSRLIKSGVMPAIKLGGQYRIPSDRLKVYMKSIDTTRNREANNA